MANAVPGSLSCDQDLLSTKGVSEGLLLCKGVPGVRHSSVGYFGEGPEAGLGQERGRLVPLEGSSSRILL